MMWRAAASLMFTLATLWSAPNGFAQSMHEDGALVWGAGIDADATSTGWLSSGTGTLVTWDAFVWAGDDDVKLRMEVEGEASDGTLHDAELRALLSWNISEFWDLRTGVRHDLSDGNNTWATIGFHGMAPFFLDTEVLAFISQRAEMAIRIGQSIDIPITAGLIAKPHVELNAFLQDSPDFSAGAGLSTLELGLQFRYDLSRKFAPYIDLVYDRALAETSIIRRARGDEIERTTIRAGLRVRL